MANFESFKQKILDTAESVADKSAELYKIAEGKTKTFAKITKLSTDSSKDRNMIKKLYTEIGQMYYELHSADPEDALAQSCEEITAALERIVQRQSEIDALKASGVEVPDDISDDIDADIEIEIVCDEDEDSEDDSCCCDGDSCCCSYESKEDTDPDENTDDAE